MSLLNDLIGNAQVGADVKVTVEDASLKKVTIALIIVLATAIILWGITIKITNK